MSENSVMLVGSGAVRAHPYRGGTCQILTINGRNLLIDCGRNAVHNMSRFGKPVETIDEIYISHLHFDHVCDLPMLMLLSWNNGRSKRIPIYGPQGMRHFMDHWLRLAYADDIHSRTELAKKNPEYLEWDVYEIAQETGLVREANDFRIESLRTRHGGLDNHSFRIDVGETRIVITSDSEPDPRLAQFCQGADLLIIECSGTDEFYKTQTWGGWHMSPEYVGELARDACAGQVVLKHLVIESFTRDPEISQKMADTANAIHSKGKVFAGEDGMTFSFDTCGHVEKRR